MGYVKNVNTDITLSDGATVTIRKLSARSLERASDARQIGVAESMRKMGGDVLKSLRELEQPKKEEPKKLDPEAAKKARYASYDRGTVLVAGIVRWSYGEVETDPLSQVDEQAAEEIHEAILDYSLPPLDPEEHEAERGKGSGSFTGS